MNEIYNIFPSAAKTNARQLMDQQNRQHKINEQFEEFSMLAAMVVVLLLLKQCMLQFSTLCS